MTPVLLLLLQCSLLLLWLSFSSTTLVSVEGHRVLDFEKDFGGVAEDDSTTVCAFNTQLLSNVLRNNASDATLIFPVNRTFHLHAGVHASHLNNTRIQIDGTLRFRRNSRQQEGNDGEEEQMMTPNEAADQRRPIPECWMLDRCRNVTFTSTNPRRGLLDGRGSQYWGVPGIGYWELGENRPRLLRINLTADLLIENLIFQDSPYHTLYMEDVNRVVIRYVSIVARRTHDEGHSWIDLSAFNTDGIDVSGHNVHVHDVDIWTQDDCVAVKDNRFPPHVSSNMTFERLNASGMGLTIGSIGDSWVRNITFRDSYMHRTVKGLYLKFRAAGLIEDVLFDNITMEQPLQWPIWVGPAQQSDSLNPCYGNPCSLCWPQMPRAPCKAADGSTFSNLTFRNVTINRPKMSPGVILGSSRDPIRGITFENVRVTKGPSPEYNLLETFPGLRQPIVDHYVPGSTGHRVGKLVTGVFHDLRNLLPVDELEVLEATWESGWAVAILLSCCLLTLNLLIVLCYHPWALESDASRVEATHDESHANEEEEEESRSLEHDNEEEFTEEETSNSLEEPLLPSSIKRTRSETEETENTREEPFRRSSSTEPSVEGREEESRSLAESSRSSPPLRRRRLTKASGRLYLILTLLALDCTLFWLLYPMTEPWRTPSWNRADRYFRCAGVIDGVVKGDTWPVPRCFADDQRPGHHGSSSVLMSLLGVVVVAILCLIIRSLRQRTAQIDEERERHVSGRTVNHSSEQGEEEVTAPRGNAPPPINGSAERQAAFQDVSDQLFSLD